MRKTDVLIITTESDFAAILSDEAKRIGYSARIAEKPDIAELSECRVAVVDIDRLSKGVSELSFPRDVLSVGYSRLPQKQLDAEYFMRIDRALHRPFLLREFREILQKMLPDKPSVVPAIMAEPEKALPERSFSVLLDSAHSALICNRETVHLSKTEFAIMSLLLERRGEALSREEIAERIGYSENPKQTDVYICYLRRKIDERFNVKFIRTVRGKGYMIKKGM